MPKCKSTKGRKPKCVIHQESGYSEKYDAYYCPVTTQWLCSACNDSDCSFCADRPITAKKEIIE